MLHCKIAKFLAKVHSVVELVELALGGTAHPAL